jgi:transcriptional regulator with XRE-family HTH domain
MLDSTNKPSLAVIFRNKREEKGLLIRQVAAVTEMDQALVSRIENGDRLPTKEQLNKLAGLYDLDLKETYSAWLAERMIRDYGAEPYAPEAFREARDYILKHVSNNLVGPDIIMSSKSDNASDSYRSYKNTPAKRGPKPKNSDDDVSKT